jgi:hypothetical protein
MLTCLEKRWLCTIVSCVLLVALAEAKRVRTFTSTTEANGNQHPATADINANGIIKCTAATGQHPKDYPPACYALGQILRPGQTAGTGAGGTMTLTCNGQAPLTCTVTITD